MGGGDNKRYNLNLRKAFANTPDSEFERYVDTTGDLKTAWSMIDTYQKGGDMSGFRMHGNMTPAQQAQYWIKKAEGGRFNKADFGRFHAAEDKALLEGKYPGGTKVKPGTDAYGEYFPDDNTRYETFLAGSSSDGDDGGGGGGGGGGSPGGRNYPIALMDYVPPSAMEGIPLEYQPWIKPDHIPDSIWNYSPPTLDKWKSSGPSWDWARKPASEYAPKESSEHDDLEQRGGRTAEEIAELEAMGYTTDKYGNKHKRGFSSLANLLAGITIADEAAAAAAAAGLYGSGNVGVSVGPTAGHPGTPAASGHGVSHGSASPTAL